MTLLDILADLEERDDLHLSRLLVLLGTFAGKNGTGTVEGLTKLAKLDFLLRYPVCLERALDVRHRQRPADNIKPEAEAAVKAHERKNIESAMVRFRYGPWDFRYRRFLNLLVGMGLATVHLQGRTYYIGLTPAGVAAAADLAAKSENADIRLRARTIKRHFNIGGTALKEFVYTAFPDIVSLKLGEVIRHEH